LSRAAMLVEWILVETSTSVLVEQMCNDGCRKDLLLVWYLG